MEFVRALSEVMKNRYLLPLLLLLRPIVIVIIAPNKRQQASEQAADYNDDRARGFLCVVACRMEWKKCTWLLLLLLTECTIW